MTDRRLMFISGATASGKTTTAREVSRRLGAGWLQVDTLWRAIVAALPEGSEKRTLLSLADHSRLAALTAGELLEQHRLADAFICGTLPRALAVELAVHERLVVDGAWLEPSFMAGFTAAGVRVSGVVIHEAEAEEVRAVMRQRSGIPETQPWQRWDAWWLHGNWLAAEAAKYGVGVVAARPRESLVERVLAVVAE